MNITQRLEQVRSKVHKIGKDAKVMTYKAVTHDKVTEMLREHLIQAGVLMLPSLVSDTVTPLKVKNKQGAEVYQFFYSAVYEFKFVNAENPEDFVITCCSGQAYGNDDKGAGKALSYATKMMMLKVFNMVTGENDEARDPNVENAGAVGDIPSDEQLINKDQIKILANKGRAKVDNLKDDLIPLLNKSGYNVKGLGEIMQGEFDGLYKMLDSLPDVQP